MKLKLKHLINKLLTTVYPKRCPCCEKVIYESETLCSKCQSEFNGITYRKYAKGGYDCVSAVPYDGVFARGIKNFKFKNRRQYANQLASIIHNAIKCEYSDIRFDYITYVPLHPKKLSERGYNQSELLAKELSEFMNIPLVEALYKTRNNQPQHKLTAKKRSENVQGVYKLKDDIHLSGKTILLIDDIITTGNTLGECAKTLDACSPLKIYCATFAVSVVKTT